MSVAETKLVISAIDNASGKIDHIKSGMDKFTGSITAAAIKLSAYNMAIQVVVSTVNAMVAPIVKAGIASEALGATLKATTGSVFGAASANQYLADTANQLGLNFVGLTQGFVGISAAAKGTTLEGQKVKDIFDGVSMASAVLHLSTEQTNGALLALSQMISKGSVQAEELRGQLGERLPGSFQLAAKAMGVTTSELGKMLEQGQVVSADFLPKFAKALKDQYGSAATEAATTTQAAVARMENSWESIKRKLGESILPGISAAVAGINAALEGIAPSTTAGKIEKLKEEIEDLQTRISQPLYSSGLVDELNKATEELKRMEYVAAGITWETGQWAKGVRDMNAALDARWSTGDSWRGFAKGKEDAYERGAKDEHAADVAAGKEADEKALKAIRDAAAKLKEYNAHLVKTNDAFAKLSMSSSDYAKYDLAQTYAEETKVLGTKNAALNETYRMQLLLIEANKRLNDPMEKKIGNTDSFMGRAEADAAGLKDLVDLENKTVNDQEQIQIDLTDKINQLTLSAHDYKIWALDQEVQKLRDVAGEEKELQRQITDYQLNKLKEIEKSQTSLLSISKHTAKEMEKAFSTLFFDALTGKFKTFEDYLTGIMNAISKMVSDQMAAIARKIMFGQNENAIGGLVGAAATAITSYFTPSGSYPIHHAGGVIGEAVPSGYANVNPAVFYGAPRLHSGLASDEYPAILQKGETVIPKGGAAVSANQPPKVTVNVYNNSGAQLKTTPKIDFDAQGLVVNLWLDALDRNAYGLRSSIGM